MGTIWRNPRTQQERRINSSNEYCIFHFQVHGTTHELRIRIRGSRSLKMLVQEYHDLCRGIQRSWKEHRKTQYKVREISPGAPEGQERPPTVAGRW